jgi:hypothetical protein
VKLTTNEVFWLLSFGVLFAAFGAGYAHTVDMFSFRRGFVAVVSYSPLFPMRPNASALVLLVGSVLIVFGLINATLEASAIPLVATVMGLFLYSGIAISLFLKKRKQSRF